ncbi:filamentous hemagglutinin N-terminal domain-containing protein [Pararobbsia alpina]|uniref:two-partner secretion domain-containing protein n=1 Tax=Pararobbsia alpina TaxID=621374 RepID=UPI0039A458ED
MTIVGFVLPSVSGFAAGIVPDGQTATTVTTNPNGRQVVTIATPATGVSNNTYSSFNVSAAGASLDNTAANARLIVNQVTSTNPSVIQGDISVLGPRANVILANPNGITVNGGSFTNVGHMALATGLVTIPSNLSNAQPYVTLNTTKGSIIVGSSGMAGTLIGLELIAKTIQVNGPITNQFSSSTAGVRLIGGASQISVDSGLSPTDNNNDWLSIANQTLANPNAIAIDVTGAGSITSGHVQLIVTEQGAGVKHEGTILANAGDFDISSNGTVEFTSTSTATAAGNLGITATDSIAVNGAMLKGNTATFASGGTTTFNGGNLITTNGIDFNVGNFVAQNDGANESTIASSQAGVVIDASGNITNTSSLIQGAVRTAGDTASHGAVTLNAGGNILNTSVPQNAFGVLFGQNDDVSITAAGDITNHAGRVLSNENVVITAQGDFANTLDEVTGQPGTNQPSITSYSDSSTRLLVFSHHENGVTINYGSISDANQVPYISADAGSVTISARNVSNTGGVIQSNDGNISITAQQSIANLGAFAGQASFSEWCFFVCHRSASSSIQAYGGQIQAGGDIALSAGQSISNVGGNVIAGGNLTLSAPTVTASGVPGYTSYNRNRSLKEWFGSSWAAIFAADVGGLFDAGTGTLTIDGEGVIDGGSFVGARGVVASHGIVTQHVPYHQPITIDNSLGLISLIGL